MSVAVALLEICGPASFRIGVDTGNDVACSGCGDGEDVCDAVREELVSQL